MQTVIYASGGGDGSLIVIWPWWWWLVVWFGLVWFVRWYVCLVPFSFPRLVEAGGDASQ